MTDPAQVVPVSPVTVTTVITPPPPKQEGFFQRIGDFFGGVGNWFAGVFGSKEANCLYHAALAGAVTYGSSVIAGQVQPTWLGIGGAVLGGLIGYLRGDGTSTASVTK